MPLAFVALGANLAEPAEQVRAALGSLAQLPECRVLRSSSLYRTAPVGIHGQPDFINAVAALETVLTPQDLLAALFAIEAQFGRRRDYRHAPRTLDLDLLLYGDERIDAEGLTVPHPRIAERAFVLVPLVEVSPEVMIPGLGPARDALAAIETSGCEALG